MTFRPFTVARWGMYVAAGAAVLSIWLGHNAGASLDFLMLRAVFVFVIVTLLGLGAEATLSMNFTPPPVEHRPVVQPASGEGDESE